jgi:vacuolar-type H+-ATPase subunit I/STV1
MNINFRDDKIDAMKAVVDPKQLTDKVEQLKNLEDEIQNAEQSISKLKEQAKAISEFEIPEMMKEMNITKLKLTDGESVEVKNFYSASLSQGKKESDSDYAARKQQAFTWLRNNGLGDIIKNDITVTFGKGEDNKAANYAVLARGQGYEPVQKEGVHTQTLKALVGERVESGLDVPSDLFKTYVGNRTKITRS